jgi:hypothetical protein
MPEQGIHPTEDGCVGRNPDRERQDRHGGEAGVAAEQTKTEREILPEGAHSSADPMLDCTPESKCKPLIFMFLKTS